MRIPMGLVLSMVVPLSTFPLAALQPSSAKTVPESINYMWKMVEKDFTSLVEAMPEEKWNFKPVQGAFSNVRTFAEQVKHVACGTEAWAKKLGGQQPPADCDRGGPNAAKTKSEILAYLDETFAMMDEQIAATKLENLMSPVKGPYAGENRFEVLTSALWHISDHYGQLIEYARMNGIVPPASQ